MDMHSTELQHARPDAYRMKRILERMFRDYTGCLGVRFWNGDTMTLGRGSPSTTIVFNTVRSFCDFVLRRDPLQFVEAHFLGAIDIEGDLYSVLTQRTQLPSLKPSGRDILSLFSAALLYKLASSRSNDDHAPVRWSKPLQALFSGKSSRELDRKAISFHYDVSNDFYRLWLDEQMVYSCAYFHSPDDSIDQAQRNKLDLICRKLRLKPGERMLDVGCGWGALVCWAAQHYGVSAHGITLSRQQYEYARNKIRDLGLEGQVTVEMRHYRDLPADASFDKVSSIGMFEHVGIKNLPAYYQAVRGALRPGGLFLNHGITNDVEGWQDTVGIEFIQRYVFPESELETVSNVQRGMEQNNFEVVDVESLRAHYALTLRHWVKRLEAEQDKAIAEVGDARYRVWRMYMAGCASQFELGEIGVYQILAVKRRPGLVDMPLTRRDLYQ
jgi:cyclopropane-fatty-acyl-phospholipid synthase